MTPEEVVLQLKRNGTFDDLRKKLLSDFQSGDAGQQFLDKLKAFMEEMIAKDSSLIERDSSFFHDQVSNELERSGIYNAIRDEVMVTLKEDYYQQRVDNEINSVKEKVQK